MLSRTWLLDLGPPCLAELTTFDLVLLMVIGEATQQALLGDDFSLSNAVPVIVTLIAIGIGFSLVKQRSRLSRMLDGGPTIVVEDGKVLAERLKHARLATKSCALPQSNRNVIPGQGSPYATSAPTDARSQQS